MGVSAGNQSRTLLQGVPQIGFYPDMRHTGRCPEDLPFASCVRACLEYLGEEVGCRHCLPKTATWGVDCAYAFILGVSGVASFLSWRPGWDFDNADVSHMSNDRLAPYQRTFDALGYGFRYLGKEHKAAFRKAVVGSIREGSRPVLAGGVVGPPECAIITGYDDGGDTVMGWSFFQNDPEFAGAHAFEPSGEFRKSDWLDSTEWLLLWGKKSERPPLKDSYRGALEWMLHVSRTPLVTVGGEPRFNGHAAYGAWANQVALGEGLDTDNLSLLRERHFVHDGAVGFLAEARWYGSQFLARAAGSLDRVAEPLLKAAACYAAEHTLMWQVWKVLDGPGPAGEEQLRRFAQSEPRAEIANLLLEAQARDVEACEWIERALGV